MHVTNVSECVLLPATFQSFPIRRMTSLGSFPEVARRLHGEFQVTFGHVRSCHTCTYCPTHPSVAAHVFDSSVHAGGLGQVRRLRKSLLERDSDLHGSLDRQFWGHHLQPCRRWRFYISDIQCVKCYPHTRSALENVSKQFLAL